MKNRSKIVLVNSILATIYLLYILIRYGKYLMENFKLFLEILNVGFGVSIASATLIIPIFVVFLFIGMIFSYIGYFLNKNFHRHLALKHRLILLTTVPVLEI